MHTFEKTDKSEKSVKIEPRVLKGFRDFLPNAELARRTLLGKIEASFQRFGFAPIDTPALEYAEILLGKGGGETEKQVYRFTDNGGREVALRFDLTVPFARFVAEHRAEIVLPFKRYHIAKVWRGENTQRGRYREFTQCDFDIVGSDSAASDLEILLLIPRTLHAIGAGNSTVRLNHRGLFNRFLAKLDLLDKSLDILRLVDKLGKIGRDEVQKQLTALIGAQADTVLRFINAKGAPAEVLAELIALSGGPSAESDRLTALLAFLADTDSAHAFVLDPSITRGLDYYTGLVCETFLNDLPAIGSICSGGRYDNLTGLYSKDAVSGVGASIGLDRLIAALETLGTLNAAPNNARVALACINDRHAGFYQTLAERFRSAGIAVEVFFSPEKLPKQYAAAEKKGYVWLAIPADNPKENDALVIRNLPARENSDPLPLAQAVSLILSHEKPAP